MRGILGIQGVSESIWRGTGQMGVKSRASVVGSVGPETGVWTGSDWIIGLWTGSTGARTGPASSLPSPLPHIGRVGLKS
jgi:hypothetical protein